MAFGAGKLKTMPVNVMQSAGIQQLLRLTVARAVNEMNLVNTTAIESAKKAFTDAVNQCFLEVNLGIYSHQEAIRKAVRKMAEEGIKGAHYKSTAGRETFNYVDTAIKRAVLTSSRQVALDMQMERANEWNSDLVEVSSHVGARPSHAVWQGQVYSLSGKSKKYKHFASATGYGDVTGLGGANCNHSFYPFFEGLSTRRYYPVDEELNKKRYEDTQKQRLLERNIRKDKRRIIGAEASGDHASVLKHNQKLKERQKELREHVKRSKLTRRRDRERVLGYNTNAVSYSRNVLSSDPNVLQATMLVNAQTKKGTAVQGIIPKGAGLVDIKVIAKGQNIREVDTLVKNYGGSTVNWNKVVANVEGKNFKYHIHYYESQGLQVKHKIKTIKEQP